MIRTLMATTAFAALLATSAMAQEAATPAPAPAATTPAPVQAVTPAPGHLASSMIGETVYNGAGNDAQNIGDVNDLVIADNGTVDSVIIGVGGFLGLGEKNVAMKFSDFTWHDADGDRWLIVPATKEQLQALPAFDRTPYQPAPAATAATDTNAPAMGVAPADQNAMAPAPAPTTDSSTNNLANNTMAPAPAANNAVAPTATDTTATAAIDRSTLTEIPAGDLTADNLVGTTVYGANDANVGEIGDIVLTADGKVDAVVLDVGGFLGIGEKQVAVGMDKLSFMQDANGTKYLYTDFTKEQLEAATTYDASTYASQRDQQRLTVVR